MVWGERVRASTPPYPGDRFVSFVPACSRCVSYQLGRKKSVVGVVSFVRTREVVSFSSWRYFILWILVIVFPVARERFPREISNRDFQDSFPREISRRYFQYFQQRFPIYRVGRNFQESFPRELSKEFSSERFRRAFQERS